MYLVIDVGGTFIKHCVMNRDAEIMEKNKFPTPGRFGNGLENFLMRFSRYMMATRTDMIFRESRYHCLDRWMWTTEYVMPAEPCHTLTRHT